MGVFIVRLIVSLIVSLFVTPAVLAQGEPIEFFQVEGLNYDTSVPAPEEVFGFNIGERPVRHDQMVAYLTDLARRSDRIQMETIGYSHEMRPILFFTVTSPDNQENIDQIKQAHLSRRLGDAPEDAAPVVVWLNYGVHGAESAGMDAAIPLLYHFAAAEGQAVEAMLDESVILVTAIFNPDGHTRRIDHVNTYWSQTTVTDPQHTIHNLWIEARTNHYWFDLNRQWLLLTQPEAQAWTAKWHEWKPMVSADYHEMGTDSPFYFHPGEPLRLNPLIPETARDLTLQIAERHVDFLDSEARLYTAEEGFDNFYIGKGSTYPQVNGSLGILFEIGAARGGHIESDRGLVDHADNVRTHFRTSLTTVQGAIDISDELITYQRRFFADAPRLASQDRIRGYVFTHRRDPERTARFIRLLNQHDVDVYELARTISVRGESFEAGTSFVVPMNQDQYRMIRGLFDTPTEFEENIFYDVSGWTLPLAYDLDYAELAGGAFANGLLGEPASGEASTGSGAEDTGYGFIFDWGHTYAPRALQALLRDDVLVRVAREAFTVDTTEGELSFEPGAVFVPVARQRLSASALLDLINDVATDSGITVHTVTSGFTPVTGRDLGSGVFEPVEAARVIIAHKGGISHYDAGEMWWTLDQQMGVPAVLVQVEELDSVDWPDYTHLILAGDDPEIEDDVEDRIDQWVREDGGTIIATLDAAVWAQSTFAKLEAEETEADNEDDLRIDFADMGLRDAEDIIGGAIFETDLDITHPLGFGHADRVLPVHRNGIHRLARPDDDPFAVVAEYTDAPLMAGYASERRQGEIAGTPAIVTHRLGSGALILFADNPVFRATFPGTERVLMNAISLDDLIDRTSGDYEE